MERRHDRRRRQGHADRYAKFRAVWLVPRLCRAHQLVRTQLLAARHGLPQPGEESGRSSCSPRAARDASDHGLTAGRRGFGVGRCARPANSPLSIFPGPRFAAADFRPAPSNADACAWLRRTAEWPNRRLALWGEAGRGKTHLLHIWAERTGAALRTGAGLSGLPDIPAAGIALDDADAVADERALLHMLNAAGEAGLPVLLAARPPPARWAGASARPGQPAARHRPRWRSARRRTRCCGHCWPGCWPIGSFGCRSRCRNGWCGACRAAPPRCTTPSQRLDAVSLDQHRNITVPFAAQVLADLLAPDEISGSESDPSQERRRLSCRIAA